MFLASTNPQDRGPNRYLLPCLAALPVAGGALSALYRRHRIAAATVLAVALLYPTVHSVPWLVARHALTPQLTLGSGAEPLREVVEQLERAGYAGGYSRYWDAYRATFLAGERLVFVPHLQWDRFPPYRRRLQAATRVVWFYPGPQIELSPEDRADAALAEDIFLNQLASAGQPWERRWIAGYRVYSGPRGERLLPGATGIVPHPLQSPRLAFAPFEVPARAASGTELAIPVRVTNLSDGPWTTAGLPLAAGRLRVSLAYRWLRTGAPALVPDGQRSHLPQDVLPGEAVDMRVRVIVPEHEGSAILRLTAVQEGVAWFDDVGGGSADHQIEIAPAPDASELP
jgi:hypothetical protein